MNFGLRLDDKYIFFPFFVYEFFSYSYDCLSENTKYLETSNSVARIITQFPDTLMHMLCSTS